MTEARQQFGIGVLLVAQLWVAAISIQTVPEIGIFCTAPRDRSLEYFGWVHALFLGLLPVGLASLAWKPARLPYVVMLLLFSTAIPLQYSWVEEGRLYCDAP
jgi:hypothetical protein